MAVEIKELKTKPELKKFIKFQIDLYAGVAQFVPPFRNMELNTLLQDKNPAYDFCESKFWMAFRDNKPVGRIGAIVHGTEIKVKPIIRFGWFDFIDDQEVFDALIQTVSDWAKVKHLTEMHGPIGFTDLDFAGTLIDGFDQIMSQAGLYNYPYYLEHYDRVGFTKSVDWVEIRVVVPDKLPFDTSKAHLLSKRYKMHTKEFKSSKEILKYGQQIFELLNETYSHLYGYFPLTQKQIDYYIKAYFGFVKKELIIMIVDDEDKIIGFAVALPSLSQALKKAKGSLYPFGFLHILKAFKTNTIADLFLIATKDSYKNKGVNALMWVALYKQLVRFGIKELHTGRMLEENKRVLNMMIRFEDIPADSEIKRRCFIKSV